jgi:DNA repair exonuclease SbcCD ATPase subunit
MSEMVTNLTVRKSMPTALEPINQDSVLATPIGPGKKFPSKKADRDAQSAVAEKTAQSVMKPLKASTQLKEARKKRSTFGTTGTTARDMREKVKEVKKRNGLMKPRSALDATDASAEKGSEENESGKIAKVKAKRWTTRKNKVSAKENVAEPAPDAVVEELEAKLKELETKLDQQKIYYEAKIDANLTQANQRIAEKEAEIAALEKKLRRAPAFEGNESEELEKVRAKCAKLVKKIENLAKENNEYLAKIATLNAELEDLRAPQPESAIPETEAVQEE